MARNTPGTFAFLGGPLIGGLVLCGCGGAAEPAGPSVLLVTIDSLRADRLGCYGYARETTPNLDAFASEAALFERAYAHAPFTAPSHASLFTSLHTQSHGVYAWEETLDPAARTLAERLAAAGWRTGCFYNHPGLRMRSDVERGFETRWLRAFGPADDTVDAFLDWADAGDAPFAAWVHLWDVHRPYAYRDWSVNFFEDPELAVPHGELAYGEQRFGRGDPLVGRSEAFYNLDHARRATEKHTTTGARVLGDDDLRFIADRYDSGVAHADRGIRRLLAGLAERGLDRSTVVVITSDHGEALTEREPCFFTHDPFLYEETLRVPLLVRFPDRRFAGRRVPALVRGIDVLPTLLELADLPSLPQDQGRSLVGLLDGSDAAPRALFAQTQTKSAKETGARVAPPPEGASPAELARRAGSWLEHREAYVEGTHKLIRDVGTGALSVFDLAVDPAERHDLSQDPAWLARREELVSRLDALKQELRSASGAGRPLTDAESTGMGAIGYGESDVVGPADSDEPR